MLRSILFGLLSLRGLMTVAGIGAICVVIWFIGPLVAFGAFAPLVPAENRVLAIVVFVGGLIAITLVRFVLARRANQRMIKSLLDNEALASVADTRSPEERDVIRERFEAAMKALEESRSDGAQSGDLTELPWYVIIGPSGAGKTTILRNSGLEFPLAQRLGVDPVSGIGGTRYCDWWFTDKAVIIDTAGRYTVQETNAASDAAAWRGFLDLLKTHRRRRPVNGIIIAISLAEILSQSPGERKRHVDALRQRLHEIAQTFAIEIPAYVVVTKCDLVAGFSEFFDRLNDEERAQVWGMTFPLDDTVRNRLPETVRERFRNLVRRLDQMVPGRLHADRSLARRGRIFLFPKEFAAVGETVGSFVHQVFRPTRFEAQTRLRGLYFTSGTQEGTPTDRVLGAFGRAFGLPPGALRPQTGQGKAFFVRRLLTDLIFEEKGLVGTDRKLERRLALVNSSGYAAALALLVAFAMLWLGAFARSSGRIEATQAQAAVVEDRLRNLPPRLTYAALLPALDAARQMREATGRRDFFAWLDGLGLSATPTLSALTQNAYEQILLARLLPAFVSRIEDRLVAGVQSPDAGAAEQLRTLLRTYLMLGDAGRFERATVNQSGRAETTQAFPLDQDRRNAMIEHSDALVSLLPRPVTLDQRLIDLARTRLTRVPRVDQVYERLLREGAQNARLRAINLSNIVGSTSLQVSVVRQASGASVVPGLFTRDGFYEFTLPRLPALIREELGVDWISGQRGDDAVYQKLATDLTARYVADYVRVWRQALATVSAVPIEDLQRGVNVLQGLSSPQSPLETLIQTVKENTDLPPPAEVASNAAGQVAGAAGGVQAALSGAVTAIAGRVAGAATATALGDVPWPGIKIGEPFKPLIALAETTNGQQPLTRIRELMSGLFSALSGIANSPDPRQAAYQLVSRRVREPSTDVFGQLRSDAALRPDPVRAILRDIANGAWGSILGLSVDHVTEAWRRDVLPACQGAIFNRYPIFAGAQEDITLKDFGDFFRPGGVVDEFYTKFLSPLVLDQRSVYAAARIDGVALPFKPDGLAALQSARLIRNAFFAGSGAQPSAKFSLRPTFLDPGSFRAVISIDGKDIVYRQEAPRAYDLDWPTKTDASTVTVTITGVDGKETKIERTGPWALFRLVDASGLQGRGTTDRFAFTVGNPTGNRVTYQLRAASVTNPFSLAALRGFRCPDSL